MIHARFRTGVRTGWFGLAAAALVVAGPARAGSDNLLTNPGFEELGGSYEGWTAFGSGPQISTMFDDNIFRSGFAAAKIFGEFTGCPDTPTFDVGGFFQPVAAAPGDVFEFSGFSFVSDADPIPGTDSCVSNRCVAQLAFRDSGGVLLARNEVIIGDWSTPAQEWRSFFLNAPAPAGTETVEAFILFLQPSCDTGAVFIDDVKLRSYTPTTPTNLLANPSFDGGITGWSTFGNVFYEDQLFAARSPLGSGKMFSTFTEDSPSGMFQSFAASPGQSFEFSAYGLNTCEQDPINGANDNFVTARIVFRDSVGDEVGAEEVLFLDAASPLGTWTRATVTATAPAGTVAVEPFFLFISPTLMGGAVWIDDVFFGAPTPVSVPGAGDLSFSLGQNVPNPFNPTTRITFDLTRSETVSIDVYDVQGRWVTSLFEGHLDAGAHTVRWDGARADGAPAASGVYRYELTTATERSSRRMTLLK